MIRQSQLALPLLAALEAETATPVSDLYEKVANSLGIDQAERERTVKVGSQNVNVFERDVRWAQQRAKLQGLIERSGAAVWRLTEKGAGVLTKALPGVIITVFMTPSGAALWARCEDAIGHIDDESVNLIFSSPPYPLLRKKAYGNQTAGEYVDWFLRLAEAWPRKLTKDGSIVLNLADVWEEGRPIVNLYQERLLIKLEEHLGLKLCQRFAWQNPSKMPAPAEWVTVRRVRVKPALEQLYWLSGSDQPYADNRQVLKPYSQAMLDRLLAGGEKSATRPSGYALKQGAFSRDNGGAIPDNLIVSANTESNSGYIKSCKEAGLPVHPARFPSALPEFFIRMLTRQRDLVVDPFSGSFTTAKTAEALDRRWIGIECMREYIEGARIRFA